MENNRRESFRAEIAVFNDEKQKKLLKLKEKYENNEIFESDLSKEEMEALIELYRQEEKEIDRDILMRKSHISEMLKKMKQK